LLVFNDTEIEIACKQTESDLKIVRLHNLLHDHTMLFHMIEIYATFAKQIHAIQCEQPLAFDSTGGRLRREVMLGRASQEVMRRKIPAEVMPGRSSGEVRLLRRKPSQVHRQRFSVLRVDQDHK